MIQIRNQTKATQEIKTKFEQEMEVFRTDLSVLVHKREVKFSEWHSRQVSVLSDVYCRLYRAEEALRPNIPTFEPTPNEISWERREDLRICFEENAVFIPDQIRENVSYLLNRLSQVLLRTSTGNISPEEENIIIDVTGKEIPELRENIRSQIRTILSAEDDALN